MAKSSNYIMFDRAQFAGILGKIVRSIKPKEKDPALRRSLYINVNESSVDLFATNEILFMLFNSVPCEVVGSVNPFALDLAKIAKFAASARGDKLRVSYDEDGDKALVIAGSQIKLGFWTGEDYQEMIGTDNPISFPDDMSEYSPVDGVKEFRSLMRVMLTCTNDKQPYLAGIYTDGDGLFMATDKFKGMQVELDQKFGFEALIPVDFFGLLDCLGSAVLFRWEDGVLWATDKDFSVVVSSFTRSAEKFPSVQLAKFFNEMADTGEYHVTLNAEKLGESIKQIRSFFGRDDLRCNVKFKKKMILSVIGKNKDQMKDVVKYSLGEDSGDIVNFQFEMMLNVMGVIPTLFDGDFNLHIIANNRPLYSESKELGIKLMLVPFWKSGT